MSSQMETALFQWEQNAVFLMERSKCVQVMRDILTLLGMDAEPGRNGLLDQVGTLQILLFS